MTKLLIADDHLMFREGIRRLLADDPTLTVVADAANFSEVIAGIRNQQVDVAIVDFSMPGRDGVEMISHLRIQQPKLPILVLTMHMEEEYAVRALRAGAKGYLTKAYAADQLLTAVHRLASGGHYVCTSVAEGIALDFICHNGSEQPHTKLSNREYKVFEMLVTGKSPSQIANELSLSIKTVSTHKVRLMNKMNMTNQAELIRYAINNNLVSN